MNDFFNYIALSGLTPNQVYILYCIKHKLRSVVPDTQNELLKLADSGWLTRDFKLGRKTESFLSEAEKKFNKKAKDDDLAFLGPNGVAKIEEFREMFPTGSPADHGYVVRTHVKELIPRFAWFFQNHPEYDWDMVISATANYLEDSAKKGHRNLQVCKYFVQKQDQGGILTSNLATYCDDLFIPQANKELAA